MPIYEYECGRCRRISSFLVRSVSDHKVPACPKCGSKEMTRVLSRFAAPGSSKTRGESGGSAAPLGSGDFGGEDSGGGPGDMPDLAGLEDLDENDPRSMGRFLRNMAAQTGEKLDPEMDEVCRRIESGEDPESIEEKMGDSLGDEGAGEGGSDDTLYDA